MLTYLKRLINKHESDYSHYVIYSAAAAPTVDDDTGEGYVVGDVWIDTSASPKNVYRVIDVTEGAAVWIDTSLTIDELGALAALDTVDTDQIDDEAVTLAKLAHVATARFLGRVTAETGDVEALTAAQLTAALDPATTSLQGAMSATDKRYVTEHPDDQGSKTGVQSITPDFTGRHIYELMIAAGDDTLELTVNNPTNMQTGDILILDFTDMGSCSVAPSFGANIKFAGDDPTWTTSGTDRVALRYNGSVFSEMGLDCQ